MGAGVNPAFFTIVQLTARLQELPRKSHYPSELCPGNSSGMIAEEDMLMNADELRCWLRRAICANKKLEALNMLIEQLRERAYGLSRATECSDKGKCDSTSNGTENTLMKLTEAIEQADRQREKTACIMQEIQQAIFLLEDNDLVTVLTYRYLLSKSVERTAEIMNYAPRTVRKKQSEAIEKLCLLMPCNAASDVID